MSLSENKTALQEILDMVNNLPEAGGSASVETCDVVMNITGATGLSFGIAISDSSAFNVKVQNTIDLSSGEGAVSLAAIPMNTTTTATVPKGASIVVWSAASDSTTGEIWLSGENAVVGASASEGISILNLAFGTTNTDSCLRGFLFVVNASGEISVDASAK